MSAIKKTFLFLSIIIGILAILLIWPCPVNQKAENYEFYERAAPLHRLFGYVTRGLHAIGVKNPELLTKAYLEFVTFVMHKVKTLDVTGVDVEETNFDGVRVLIFKPKDIDNDAGVLYFHGGGYLYGSPELYFPVTKELAVRLKSIVVSMSYRLAPEHVYPTAQEDVVRATKYFYEKGYQQYNLNPKRIVLMGDSAGGHIVASLTQYFINSPIVNIKASVLIYPLLQSLSFNTPSYLQNENCLILPRWKAVMMHLLCYEGNTRNYYDAMIANNHSNFAIRKKFADKFDLPMLLHRGREEIDAGGDAEVIAKFAKLYTDVNLSPLFGEINNYPPTFLISCEHDIIRDDAYMMADRLKKANRTVKHVNVNTFHGFLNSFQKYAPARRTMNEIIDFIIAHR